MSAREKVNILMVDDQQGKLLTYEAILSDLGENLIKATSGREALEVLLKNEVAVILLDVNMPELSGFELAEMIHQHPRFRKIAIIFISAVHLTDLDRIKGYQRGAMDYVSVPVVPELLRAKVSLFSDLYRKTRDLEALNNELEQRVLARTGELRESAQKIRELNDQLQQRVAELESIMKVLPIGVAIAHDPNCEVITGNAALNQLLNLRQGENISLTGASEPSYRVYRNGRSIPTEQLPIQLSCATGSTIPSTEMELRVGDGPAKQILVGANPLFDDEGKVRGSVGAVVDITERKQLERTLRERAELMDLASEAIIVRNLDGTVRYWNSGAAALYGWTAEEVSGKHLHELLQTDFPMRFEDIQEALRRGERWEGNLTQKTKDGREMVVACRKSLHRDEGAGDAVLEICRDITAQLQAEEALRRSEKLAAMGKMAGIVAHEINNPLGAITNVFYLLREHPSLDNVAREYARMAEEELARVAHITKQTLAFYRETARMGPVSVPSVMDEVLEFQARQLAASKIDVSRRYIGDGVVQAFPGELKQVFLNLISNAMEAMPNGGCLRTHVYERPATQNRESGVCVCILDTGTGIDPEDAKRLFEPFFSTKSTKGTGLGLWISKGIIQKYDGDIIFRSMRICGKNVTCFGVFLPTTAPPHELSTNGRTPFEVVALTQS